MKQKKIYNGFSMLELVVALGVFIALISGVTFLAVGSYDPFTGGGDARERERYAREGLEALDFIKDRSWKDIEDNDGGTSLKANRDAAGDWVLTAGTETRGAFTRDIKITTVQRNSSDVIVASGGTVDPSTKKVVVTVSADGKADYVIETYITNWEAVRMDQTDWSGDVNVDEWSSGSTDYYSSSSMDLPTSSGILRLASTT